MFEHVVGLALVMTPRVRSPRGSALRASFRASAVWHQTQQTGSALRLTHIRKRGWITTDDGRFFRHMTTGLMIIREPHTCKSTELLQASQPRRHCLSIGIDEAYTLPPRAHLKVCACRDDDEDDHAVVTDVLLHHADRQRLHVLAVVLARADTDDACGHTSGVVASSEVECVAAAQA